MTQAQGRYELMEYDKLSPLIRGCLRKCSLRVGAQVSRDELDDLVSEVVVHLLEACALENYDPARATLKTMVYVYSRNLLYNYLSLRQNYRRLLTEVLDTQPLVFQDPQFANVELRTYLQYIYEDLPDWQSSTRNVRDMFNCVVNDAMEQPDHVFDRKGYSQRYKITVSAVTAQLQDLRSNLSSSRGDLREMASERQRFEFNFSYNSWLRGRLALCGVLGDGT